MTIKYKRIAITQEQFNWFKSDLKTDIIKLRPDLKGLNITDVFAFERLINWWKK